jgi:pimeloyl-ACP methyl ester carboxylesterase
MSTFVLVHGGWAGGWQWRDVAQALRGRSHEVYSPTLTGMGERVHLLAPSVGLDTHILDIENTLKYEDLSDVILVGYSYGGAVATGAAHRAPERIRKLIYLDAFLLEDGQCLADLYTPEFMFMVDAMAQQHGDGWRLPHMPPDAPRRTDHPIKTFHDPLKASNPEARALPKAFVYCTEKNPDDVLMAPIAAGAQRVAADPEWEYREIATTHSPWETKPAELARLLDELV